ncbi:cell division protein FtsZ [Gluconacetobacter asukensis]|uniref:Cell division protein FtsZ n=1 Tax=Gluconacetobacter asukensis TaxID=1017181 RepID=A0A7W4P0G1_9PROT|nr:cell division protein FtsZ [Gluconacetobacter asukensis]MBB2170638.1 cell division protein FtsZ [Gluconacetobacter asukensis]
MTLNLSIPQQNHSDFTPRITVIGVGGGGTNAVDNMIQSQLQGVEFVVANTDAQQLSHSKADRRVQLGPHLTQGLGAGAKPEIGRAAAEEAADELARHLEGAHMVFITAGMGGGTGTGAAPVIARMARERGILTVGVVTKPFTFEGGRRTKSADAGIAELQQYVDTLIVIPNQNLFRLATERTSWKDAFKMADNVLYMGVRGVTDLMMAPGLVNLDFADIRTVMAEMGKAMMGTGEAEGDNRAISAAEDAISNPLLEDTSMAGARGLLINITGGDDMTLYEVDQAANRIREEVAEDANIIFGSAIDESLTGRIRVSVVATGIDTPSVRAAEPQPAEAAPAQGSDTQPAAATAQPTAEAQAQADAAAQAARPAPNFMNTPPVAAPSPHSAPQQMFHQGARPSPRSSLFSEQPRAPEPQPAAQRGSLFNIVTGVLRRGATPAQETQRAEPALPEQEPSATVRQASADEVGLDIPAFLRRQP